MSIISKLAACNGPCHPVSACECPPGSILSELCSSAVHCMQLVRPEQGMRAVLESVHHDYSRRCRIINAWHAEGAAWTLTGEDEPTVSFWGSSLDMHLNWTDNLTFADGQTFSWRKVSCSVDLGCLRQCSSAAQPSGVVRDLGGHGPDLKLGSIRAGFPSPPAVCGVGCRQTKSAW
jgi:hypothetical protein